MYRRYNPNPHPNDNARTRRGQPAPSPHSAPKPVSGSRKAFSPSQPPPKKMQSSAAGKGHPASPPPPSGASRPQNREKDGLSVKPLLGLLPPSLYNPETKKVLGLFSAEDLLLAALILLLLDNEENRDPMLIYALLYLLISDYIDLPF